MSTNPEYEYLNLASMYELTTQSMAESDMDEKEKAQHLTIMEMDLFHAALEARKLKEASNWYCSVLSRREQIEAWEKEDPEADFGWYYAITLNMTEELAMQKP